MVWLWIVPLSAAALLAVFLLIWTATHGGFGFPWLRFYSRGKETGFTMAEIHTLRRAAVEADMDNPVSIFSSVKILDRTIRAVILRQRARNREAETSAIDFLGDIFEFRKRIEFNSPRFRSGLTSSRELQTGQRLKLVLPGGGSFQSSVVENLRRYLAVAYPVGPALPPQFVWKGQRVSVYLRRLDDAGYHFESKVLDDFLTRKYPILYLAHAEPMTRSQRRGSVRVGTDLPAQIYALKDLEAANETAEKASGYRARLVDLSEDGCALLVGGKAKLGLPLKAQFPLDGATICLCGTVKGITFDEKKNRSVLHVQALKPSGPVRNRILTYVYDIFDQRRAAGPPPRL